MNARSTAQGSTTSFCTERCIYEYTSKAHSVREKAHLFRYGSVVDGNVEVFLTRVQDRPLRPARGLVSKHATKKQQQTEV